VIEDEKNMKILIKFLVYSLQTLDGKKNSAIPILNFLTKERE
jgi:hypothetical protein